MFFGLLFNVLVYVKMDTIHPLIHIANAYHVTHYVRHVLIILIVHHAMMIISFFKIIAM